MNKEILVLDTSAIINQPNIFSILTNTSFIIPIEVLEELDNLKTKNEQSGFSARKANRAIDEICGGGNLANGIMFGDGNYLEVFMGSNLDLVPSFYSQNIDSRIISVAIICARNNRDGEAVKLVSSDIALRIKASSLGICAVSEDEILFGKEDLIYSGLKVINVDQYVITDFYNDGFVVHMRGDLCENQAIVLRSDESSGAIGTVSGNRIVRLYDDKKIPSIMGVSPKNKEQRFAFEFLLNKNIPLVSIVGKAGGGKTLLAAVTAMYMLDKGTYDKLVICRPAVSASNGIGFLPGPQPLDAKILTPDGWITMADVKKDSKVISRSGIPATVIGIFPKGKKNVYRIITTDGTSTECCEDHLWQTQTWEEKKRNKPGKVRSTAEIISTLETKSGRLNHYLPRNAPVEFNFSELPIEPYTLGALLGDGSISDTIILYNMDAEIISRVAKEVLKNDCTLHNDGGIGYHITSHPINNKTARPVLLTNVLTLSSEKFRSVGEAFNSMKSISNISKGAFQNRCSKSMVINNIKYEYLPLENRWQNKMKEALYCLGLSNMYSDTKFIPAQYKYSTSVADRVALLQGLMDTDGTIKKNGEASFCTTSLVLANDVIEVVRSLGGRAVLRRRDRRNHTGRKSTLKSGRIINPSLISYELNISLPKEINPFYVPRKASRHRCSYIYDARIESINIVGEKEVQCILIDDPEHLYITDEFIVTHNTKLEKLAPWIQPVFDNLKHAMKCTDTYLNLLMDKGKIEVESLSYIRGRTFPNTVMIIDEAQNATASEMKAVITRMGENSKIIITGDLEQIDSPKLDVYTSGLSTVINSFKHSELTAHITLTKTERSEISALAAKLL